MNDHEHFLRRAIRLAMNGRGRVEPNPMVGCVLVRDGRIIGEGWHTEFGGPHAEPNALADCMARGESPAGATAYVTLEPCCHTNKKTPPCAPRLIEAKLARVVIGCLDPNPEVNGKGVAMLRRAGIEVGNTSDPLEAECKQLIAPFLGSSQLLEVRPYITLKWAESSDRKVAGGKGERRRISGDIANRLVHQLRGRSDVIVVGANTARMDNPLLTARSPSPARRPQRAVLDTRLELPDSLRLFNSANDGWVDIYCSETAYRQRRAWADSLNERRISICPVSQNRDGTLELFSVARHLRILTKLPNIAAHALFEPGPKLASRLLAAGLWDRLWVFRSENTVDEKSAPNAACVPGSAIVTGSLRLSADCLTEYLNPRSRLFFAAVPSADLALATEEQAA